MGIKMIRQALIILVMLMLSGCSIRIIEAPYDKDSTWGFGKAEAYKYYDDEFSAKIELLAGTTDIFSDKYKEQVNLYIDQIKRSEAFSINYPLFIHNPYGNTPGVLYVYMGEGVEKPFIKYNVSVPDLNIPDFISSCYVNSNSAYIEGNIIGLVQGRINTINIQVESEMGKKLCKYKYELYATNKNNDNYNLILKKEKVTSTETKRLSFGLYSFYDKKISSYLFYDNNGIKRAMIITNNLDCAKKILQVENLICYQSDNNIISIYNSIGNEIYSVKIDDEYNILDYDYDNVNKRIIILSCTEDELLLSSIIIYSYEYKELIHFSENERFSEFIQCITDNNITLQSIDGKDIMLFINETNSLFRINNIDSKPVIRWIFTKKSNWENTSYEVLVLNNISKFNLNGIINLKILLERKQKEGFYTLNVLSKINHCIYFHKCIINENKNVYEAYQSVLLTETDSEYQASIYGENIILTNNSEGCFYEYDKSGNKLARYYMGLQNQGIVYKYNMSRYWL